MEDYRSLSKEEKIAFWQEHIARWRESGLSQVIYCRENNLNKNAFTWRKRSLEGKVKTRITKVSSKTVSEITNRQPPLELMINEKLRITVDRDFDPELLQRLLKTLGVYDDTQLV